MSFCFDSGRGWKRTRVIGPSTLLSYVCYYLHGNHKYKRRPFNCLRLHRCRLVRRCNHDGYELDVFTASDATPPSLLLGPSTDRGAGTARVDPDIGCALQFMSAARPTPYCYRCCRCFSSGSSHPSCSGPLRYRAKLESSGPAT